MCLFNKPKTPEPKVLAKAAAGPKNNDPDLELASVETDAQKRLTGSSGKNSLRVPQVSNTIGTAGLTSTALTIPK